MSFDIQALIRITQEAGKIALEYYKHEDKGVQLKADNSPVSNGDIAVNDYITQALQSLYPDIPIISEERLLSDEERKGLQTFFLIDPIDGTKAFISKDGSGEWTINIALIDEQRPIIGLVYAPYFDELYYACKGEGAFLIRHDQTLKLPIYNPAKRVIYRSRSHHHKGTQAYIDELATTYGQFEIIKMSSSLKFCKIASGEGVLYPNQIANSTSEWDIAAADIIVFEAGKQLIDQSTKAPPLYNKPSLKNSAFLAMDTLFIALIE